MKKVITNADDYAKICELYNSGYSREKIEKIYNVSSSVISRILKECGVSMRDDSHKGRKYSFNENYFDEITTSNQAYILGLLYADGCNSTTNNTVFIELQERDKAILDAIKKELESNHPLHFHNLNAQNPNWSNTYKFSVTNKYFSERLEELGMIRNKSLLLEFPTWLDQTLIPDFIRGYFDGDGHIEWSNTKFLTLASTETFCEYIKDYLSGIGISSSIREAANKGKTTRLLYVGKKKNILSFLDLIYRDSEMHICRKYNQYCLIKHEMESVVA